MYAAGGPRPHNTHPRPIRAASAGPWVPGHVVRPAGGSVRYSLGARPTSRACLVRQNQQRHGRPPHGAPLPRPGPATTPGRSMPVLIGHTARPVRRIFPSWQLLPAQLVVWYLRVNTRDKTKSGLVVRLSVAIAYLVGLFAGGVDGGDDLVVPNDAISCPCFSSAVSAVSAAPWRRQRPRPSPSGDVWTSYPLASALAVHIDIAPSQLPPRQSGRSATPICSWRRASRCTRPAAGAGRGAGHLATSARCCLASRRSVAGLQSSSAAATSTGKPANC